jgi:primosomal protein N'
LSLPDDVVDLAAFVATYYQEAIGLALALAVPPLAATPGFRARSPSDMRLTAQGAAALPGKLARSTAARALLDRFQQGGGTLPATAIAALPAAMEANASSLAR